MSENMEGGEEEEKKNPVPHVEPPAPQKEQKPKAKRTRSAAQKKRVVTPKTLQFVFTGDVIDKSKPIEIGVGITKKKLRRDLEHEKAMRMASPLAVALGFNDTQNEVSKLISLVSALHQAKLPVNAQQLISELLANPEKSHELLEKLQKARAMEQPAPPPPPPPPAKPIPIPKPPPPPQKPGIRKAQMTAVPVPRQAPPEETPVPDSIESSSSGPARVKFADPRKIMNRRYASWDEITDYGMWACESQDRPRYILDPIGVLLNACTDIVGMQPEQGPTKVLEAIGDNFEDFLMMGLPCDDLVVEEPPRVHLQTDVFRRVPLAECDSGRKETFHDELRKHVRERDAEMNQVLCEFHSRLQKQVHARNVEKHVPQMSKLAAISQSLWGRDFHVRVPEEETGRKRNWRKTRARCLVRQTSSLMDFYNTAEDETAAYLAETLGIPGTRNLKRKFDIRQLREDLAADESTQI